MSTCIVVPVHPPKSNWLVSFLTSLQWRTGRPALQRGAMPDHDLRVVLATSSFGDLVFFQRLLGSLNLDAGVEWFCVDSYILDTMKSGALLQRFQNNQDGCVVNLKKLLALHWAAKRGFEWALCIDSDTIAIDGLDGLFEAQIVNYKKNKYLGVSGQDGLFLEINRAASAIFPESDRHLVSEKTHNLSWYMWFFDVPLYGLSDFRRFLTYMSEPCGSLESWFLLVNHFTFDHVLFSQWRVLHESCEALDYRLLGIERLPENLTAQDVLRIADAHDYAPAWISALQLFVEPGIKRLLPNLKLAFHFDRMHATTG